MRIEKVSFNGATRSKFSTVYDYTYFVRLSLTREEAIATTRDNLWCLTDLCGDSKSDKRFSEVYMIRDFGRGPAIYPRFGEQVPLTVDEVFASSNDKYFTLHLHGSGPVFTVPKPLQTAACAPTYKEREKLLEQVRL